MSLAVAIAVEVLRAAVGQTIVQIVVVVIVTVVATAVVTVAVVAVLVVVRSVRLVIRSWRQTKSLRVHLSLLLPALRSAIDHLLIRLARDPVKERDVLVVEVLDILVLLGQHLLVHLLPQKQISE